MTMKGTMVPVINPQNIEKTNGFSFLLFVGQMEFMCIATMIINSVDSARK